MDKEKTIEWATKTLTKNVKDFVINEEILFEQLTPELIDAIQEEGTLTKRESMTLKQSVQKVQNRQQAIQNKLIDSVTTSKAIVRPALVWSTVSRERMIE